MPEREIRMVGVRAVASGGGVAMCLVALGLALGLTPCLAASESVPGAPQVGTTVLAKRHVTGLLGSEERQLKAGHRVHRDELIRTGAQSQVEFNLDDNTKLALGPDAELRLDEFAVGGGSDAKSIAVRLLKGTLRFLTGRHSSESYKIETPSATIGVRGTIFDLYIGPQGETFVLLHKGEVEVCSRSQNCRPHSRVGRVMQVTPLGLVSAPVKWTADLVRGVGAAEAFPFVGRRLVVDPVRRLTHKSITAPLNGLEQGGKTIERTFKKILPF
jgi:hypothetical protein